MIFRQAHTGDIPQIQIVRHTVKENVLQDPSLVTDQDCGDFLTRRGRGWVCEAEGKILGFAIADLQEENIWALFLRPEWEGKGIAHRLHDMMLDWYFLQGKEKVWLSTAPGTRADRFYRRAGWKEAGLHGKNELRFEMTKADWLARKTSVE